MSHLKTKISVFSIHPMYPSALFACPSSRQNVTETKVKTGIHHFCRKHFLFPCLNKAQRTAPQSLTPPKPHQLCSCLHTTCPWWQGHREFWLAQFKPSSFFSSPTIGWQSVRRSKRPAGPGSGRCVGLSWD